jgi:hypothetical protein
MAIQTNNYAVQYATGDGSTKVFQIKSQFGYPVASVTITAMYKTSADGLTVTSLAAGIDYTFDGTYVTYTVAPASKTKLSWAGTYSTVQGYFPNESVPYPVQSNYTSKYSDAFKRVVMDDAHGRYRRQFEAVGMTQTLTWQLNWNQLTKFEGFLKFDAAQACGFFYMQLHPNGPINYYRMTAYPSITYDDGDGCWQAQATVEYVRAAPAGYAKPATLPQFPSTLPQPEKAGYEIDRDNTVTRSNINGGLATERARWTDETGIFKVQWILSLDELRIWEDFVHNQILGGYAPFLGWFANGKGLVTTRVKFTDTPQVNSNGAAFTVTASCELQQIPGITYADYIGDAISLSDSNTYSESISFKMSLKTPFNDSITYTDSIKFSISRPLTDSITYAETATLVHSGYSAVSDSTTMTETITFSMAPAAKSDSVTMTAAGGIIQQDYATGYVQFGYVGKTTSFVN